VGQSDYTAFFLRITISTPIAPMPKSA